jgi:hypothetical protein
LTIGLEPAVAIGRSDRDRDRDLSDQTATCHP